MAEGWRGAGSGEVRGDVHSVHLRDAHSPTRSAYHRVPRTRPLAAVPSTHKHRLATKYSAPHRLSSSQAGLAPDTAHPSPSAPPCFHPHIGHHQSGDAPRSLQLSSRRPFTEKVSCRSQRGREPLPMRQNVPPDDTTRPSQRRHPTPRWTPTAGSPPLPHRVPLPFEVDGSNVRPEAI